jgi:DUF4097 and DUF4098 domain-containing protein YvlB
LSLTGCGSATDRTFEDTIEQSYKIEPGTSISIKSVDGSIHVYGSPASEITVQATKRAYTLKRLKQIAVNVSVQAGAVAIETNFPKEPRWGLFDRSGTVDYTIVVPDTASISTLELANGEVSVEGMRGQSVHAHLGTGRLVDHNCFSNVDVTVGSGTLTMAYEWWEPGKFSVQANIANGNAIAFFPSDAVFNLIAETVHGRIASDFAPEGERRAEPTAKINMSVNGGGDVAIKLGATEGNIKIVEQNP